MTPALYHEYRCANQPRYKSRVDGQFPIEHPAISTEPYPKQRRELTTPTKSNGCVAGRAYDLPRRTVLVTLHGAPHPKPRMNYGTFSLHRRDIRHKPGCLFQDSAIVVGRVSAVVELALPHRGGDVVEGVRCVKRTVLRVPDHRRRQVVEAAHIRHLSR